MGFASYLEEATVLFLYESPRLEDRIDERLPEFSTRFAVTTEEAYAAFDSTVTVVFVSDTVSAAEVDEFSRAVLSRNPFCQFVLCASARATTTPHATEYDEVVHRPVAEDELRSVLERRLTYGLYSSVLHEYYSLNASAAVLERLPDGEVGQSSSSTEGENGEVAAADDVEERAAQLRPLVRRLESALSDEDIREISASVKRHRRYLSERDADDQGGSSKYHPDSCPECGLAWGGDYRAVVGNGFTTIGAGVWRCERCNQVVHGLHDSNQRVNRK